MACDHAKPGRKFLGIAHAPARFPCFHERILHGVLGFFAVLENAVGNGEERSGMRADDHFKCLAIAVNGGPVNFALIGVHHVDLQPRRLRRRFGANFFEFL